MCLCFSSVTSPKTTPTKIEMPHLKLCNKMETVVHLGLGTSPHPRPSPPNNQS